MDTIKKWMNLSENEAGLFFWSCLLIFIIRCSGLLFNNFSETAFLKRFGVEYLPLLYIVNPVITLLVLGKLSGIMERVSGYRILAGFLLFCGITTAAFRALIPLELDIIYPILFVMKVQFETLLGVLFWHLANDLFNLRQSKRLFPLITAGGVIGDICGSFFTPVLAGAVSINNLPVVYGLLALSGAVLVRQMGRSFPAGLVSKTEKKVKKGGDSFLAQLRQVRHLAKDSTLVTVLVLLTFFANVVLPVMNFQFNFAVDAHFVTESDMIGFFGYFRGVMNIVSLGLLFFSGRFYGKFGLAAALMFHPVNYVVVFLAFLFRFDIFSAMYARFSTNVVRTTFNKPVSNILIGIFPESHRAKIRPFLRGTVARGGLILGSVIILGTEGFMPPAYLSLAVLPFVAGWIITAGYLKRRYPALLSNLLSKNMIDFRSMEDDAIEKLFRDKTLQQELVETFRESVGEDALLYARILTFLSVEGLDDHILHVMEKQDRATARRLMPYLSGSAGDKTFKVLKGMMDMEDTDLMITMISTVKRLESDACRIFYRELVSRCREKETDACTFPEVKAYSNACLFSDDPQKYGEVIASWLNSADKADVKSGVLALGEIGDKSYIPRLKSLLAANSDNYLSAHIIDALRKLEAGETNHIARDFLYHDLKETRAAALRALTIENDTLLENVIGMLSERDQNIRHLAEDKIRTASYRNNPLLFAFLNKPCRMTRESIFRLIEEMDIKYVDLFYFFKNQIALCYTYLMIIERLEKLEKSAVVRLLTRHLDERKDEFIKTVLRVSAIKDETGQMRPIFRGFYSKDTRHRANAVEAIENTLDPAVVKILMPLIEGSAGLKAADRFRHQLKLPDIGQGIADICSFLVDRQNSVTVMLALFIAVERKIESINPGKLSRLSKSTDPVISRLAGTALNRSFEKAEETMAKELTIYEKIMHIQKVDIFRNLSINELAAVASITEEVFYPENHTVFTEGDVSETMYIAVSGGVKVSRNNTEVGKFRAGDSFGLSAFLVDDRRLVTCTTEKASHLLVIHKREFEEMLLEYPQISLELAKMHARMIQRLLNRIGSQDNTCEYALSDFFNEPGR